MKQEVEGTNTIRGPALEWRLLFSSHRRRLVWRHTAQKRLFLLHQGAAEAYKIENCAPIKVYWPKNRSCSGFVTAEKVLYFIFYKHNHTVQNGEGIGTTWALDCFKTFLIWQKGVVMQGVIPVSRTQHYNDDHNCTILFKHAFLRQIHWNMFIVIIDLQ